MAAGVVEGNGGTGRGVPRIAMRIATWALALVGILAAAATAWYQLAYLPARLSRADPHALAALRGDAAVRVDDAGWIALWPAQGAARTGLVFYPGGEVEAEGYAEPLRAVAAAGYPVVLVCMPLHLAVLAPDRAADVMAAYPDVARWVVGGHSLGGAMAARFVARHPGRMAGLLLWDAYPAPEDDLARATLPVLQLHREEPGGDAPAAYRESAALLPAQAVRLGLPGASHMNYGHFVIAPRVRAMPGSMAVATIPVGLQHRLVVEATLAFLGEVEGRPAAPP